MRSNINKVKRKANHHFWDDLKTTFNNYGNNFLPAYQQPAKKHK
ncbi:MAG TPA: hypothetical protein QF753_11520 [Victivallales bacterium]|nr:hypothetical protein [Victivallales bacterium]